MQSGKCIVNRVQRVNCVGAVSVDYEPHSTGLSDHEAIAGESRNGAGQGHVILVRLEGDRRVKKIVGEPKWGGSGLSVIVLESENGNN